MMLGAQRWTVLQATRSWSRSTRAAARAAVVAAAFAALAAGSAAAASVAPADSGSVLVAAGVQGTIVGTNIHNGDHLQITQAGVYEMVHPQVAVAGFSGTPTGQVEFHVYANGTCSGSATTAYTMTLDGSGQIDTTHAFTSETAASRSVRVRYLGNATYAAADGPCKSVAFVKRTPPITVHVHDAAHENVTSVPFIDTVHLAVTVEEFGDIRPKNWIVTRSWLNGDCSGSDYVFSTTNLDEYGSAHPVLPLGFDTPGTRSYRVHYSGDIHYNPVWSDCISVKGAKLTPRLGVQAHNAQHSPSSNVVLLGTPVHASVSLRGDAHQPKGFVTVQAFTGEHCDVQVTQWTLPAAQTVDSLVTTQARTSPGFGSWRVEYPGDPEYKPATSGCTAVRWIGDPEVKLTAHDKNHNTVSHVPLGTTLHFRAAVLSDFQTPTGKVAIRKLDDASCTSGAAFDLYPLSGGVVDATSIAFSPKQPGTYYFEAYYFGDQHYSDHTSSCLAVTVEAVSVTPSPTPKPTPKPTAKPTMAPKPTPKPTATASPTSAPDATDGPAASAQPSPAPEGQATAAPVATDPATASDAPGSTQAVAGVTDAPGATSAPGSTDAAGAGGTTPGSGSASAGDDGSPIGLVLLLVLVVGLVAIGSWFAVRARRPRTQPAVKAS